MMEYDTIQMLEQRRRNIRIVLFIVILGTLPFYCAGFLLWGTAGFGARESETTLATNTPIGSNLTALPTGFPTVTPLSLTSTLLSPLQPTPLQFNPGSRPTVFVPTQNVIQPTIFIPTSTLAPTLTPFPTQPPVIPTSTPLPTDVPIPTKEPLPTFTPLPTETPTETPLPIEPPVEVPTQEVVPGA